MLQLISMCFLPRTPHFLISRSRDSEAVTVLKLIHRDKDVGKEMTNIRQSLEMSTKASCSNLFSMEVIEITNKHYQYSFVANIFSEKEGARVFF